MCLCCRTRPRLKYPKSVQSDRAARILFSRVGCFRGREVDWLFGLCVTFATPKRCSASSATDRIDRGLAASPIDGVWPIVFASKDMSGVTISSDSSLPVGCSFIRHFMTRQGSRWPKHSHWVLPSYASIKADHRSWCGIGRKRLPRWSRLSLRRERREPSRQRSIDFLWLRRQFGQLRNVRRCPSNRSCWPLTRPPSLSAARRALQRCGRFPSANPSCSPRRPAHCRRESWCMGLAVACRPGRKLFSHGRSAFRVCVVCCPNGEYRRLLFAAGRTGTALRRKFGGAPGSLGCHGCTSVRNGG